MTDTLSPECSFDPHLVDDQVRRSYVVCSSDLLSIDPHHGHYFYAVDACCYVFLSRNISRNDVVAASIVAHDPDASIVTALFLLLFLPESIFSSSLLLVHSVFGNDYPYAGSYQMVMMELEHYDPSRFVSFSLDHFLILGNDDDYHDDDCHSFSP